MNLRSITEKQQHRVVYESPSTVLVIQATNALPVAIFYSVDLLCSKCAELGARKYIKEGELKGYFMSAWEMSSGGGGGGGWGGALVYMK